MSLSQICFLRKYPKNFLDSLSYLMWKEGQRERKCKAVNWDLLNFLGSGFGAVELRGLLLHFYRYTSEYLMIKSDNQVLSNLKLR